MCKVTQKNQTFTILESYFGNNHGGYVQSIPMSLLMFCSPAVEFGAVHIQ